MASLAIRVDDDYKEKFRNEWIAKGYPDESTYLKEIIDARHEIQFLKESEGVIVFLPHHEQVKYEALSALKRLELNDWILFVLRNSQYDSHGNPFTDTSIFENAVNTTQRAGLHVFTNINEGVNNPVNACKQENAPKTSDCVNTHIDELFKAFSRQPREELFSYNYITTLIEELAAMSYDEALDYLNTFKQSLKNAENVINYYYQNGGLAMTALNKLKLNLMLYEGIKAEEVQATESIFVILNSYQ